MKYNEVIKKIRLKMCLTQTEFGALFGVAFGLWGCRAYLREMEIKEWRKG